VQVLVCKAVCRVFVLSWFSALYVLVGFVVSVIRAILFVCVVLLVGCSFIVSVVLLGCWCLCTCVVLVTVCGIFLCLYFWSHATQKTPQPRKTGKYESLMNIHYKAMRQEEARPLYKQHYRSQSTIAPNTG